MRIRIIERDIWTVGYIESSGKDDLGVFLDALTGKDEIAAMGMLELFANIANEAIHVRQLPIQLCKNIGNGIREFRKGSLRILWFYDSGSVIICSHGFMKSTKKTPDSEKKRAVKNYERYQKSKSDVEFVKDD